MSDTPVPGEVWHNKDGGLLYYFITKIGPVTRYVDVGQPYTEKKETTGIWFRYLGHVSFIAEDQRDGFSYLESFENMGLTRYS